MQTEAEKSPGIALLALGFRPFFLAAAIAAVLLMALTLVDLISGGLASYFSAVSWHGHEMLFGFAAAVIAGFLLTAVRNWTGLATPTGLPLMGLLLVWLAGRVAPFLPGLPGIGVTLLDIAFLPLLALVIGQRLWQTGQRRNLIVPLLLLMLAVANGLLHAEQLGVGGHTAARGLLMAVNLIVLLIAIIAGRVIPFFTRSALPEAHVRTHPRLEKLAVGSLAAYAVSATVWPASAMTAAFALLAAGAHGCRLLGWHDAAIWRRPMLWVLFVGYGWLVLGLILQAAAALAWLPLLPAVHALTAGAIGMFTLGMMARVALGHTGRPIQADGPLVAAFVLVLFAAVLRTFVPLLLPARLGDAYMAAAVCWMLAFTVFLIRFTPILLRPRIDGRPG